MTKSQAAQTRFFFDSYTVKARIICYLKNGTLASQPRHEVVADGDILLAFLGISVRCTLVSISGHCDGGSSALLCTA